MIYDKAAVRIGSSQGSYIIPAIYANTVFKKCLHPIKPRMTDFFAW